MSHEQSVQRYKVARAEWLAAIAARRPHNIVSALWDVVVLAARKINVVPGAES